MILLYLGWAFVSVACALVFFVTFNRWAGLVALAFPLVMVGPAVLRQVPLVALGLEDRFTVFGGQVEIRGGEPATFGRLDSRWLAPERPRRFTLPIAGARDPVTFAITSVVVPGGTRDGVLAEVAGRWTACPGRKDTAGLWRLEASLPQVPGCPAAEDGARVFYVSPAPALVQCTPEPKRAGSCSMDLLAGGMEVTVTFAVPDLGLWDQMRVGVQAAVEAGFRAVPQGL